jgi:hypothetical protein
LCIFKIFCDIAASTPTKCFPAEAFAGQARP